MIIKGGNKMSDYLILTESTCDLPAVMADELNLSVAPLSVLIDGKNYTNYLDGRELSYSEFYNFLRQKKLPNTTAVNVYQFLSIMEPILQAGKDILYLGFSSAMSGSYNAGCAAATELLAKYPERKIYTVDTLSASLGQGLLVYLAAREKANGKSIEEVRYYAEANRLNMCHSFTVNDLFYIMHGGRVSATTAVIGSILSIKPILRVDDNGLMDSIGKARGRKAALNKLVDNIEEALTDPDLPIFIGHGDCKEDADYLSARMSEKLGVKNIIIGDIGIVCGSHAGPGIIGVFYHGKER